MLVCFAPYSDWEIDRLHNGDGGPVGQMNLSGSGLRQTPLRAQLVGGLGAHERDVGAGVDECPESVAENLDFDVRTRGIIYTDSGITAAAAFPVRAAFPDGGWQSRVSTPSFPQREQNLRGGRLQSRRVCPRCLHLQQQSSRL